MSSPRRHVFAKARLVRTLAHALRHEPEKHGLRLDKAGWADLEAMLRSLRKRSVHWRRLGREDLEWFVNGDRSERFECRGNRIRALYGHTVRHVRTAAAQTPPATLYHATTTATVAAILKSGLHPMGRRHVHLTSDVRYARQVGRAKSCDWTLLAIDALRASAEGTRFFLANHHIWQTAFVAPRFLHVMEHTDSACVGRTESDEVNPLSLPQGPR